MHVLQDASTAASRHESLEVGYAYPHGVHDAHVRECVLTAEPVHRRGAHLQNRRDLAHSEQLPGHAFARGHVVIAVAGLG